jgi:hypothetical protein
MMAGGITTEYLSELGPAPLLMRSSFPPPLGGEGPGCWLPRRSWRLERNLCHSLFNLVSLPLQRIPKEFGWQAASVLVLNCCETYCSFGGSAESPTSSASRPNVVDGFKTY